MNQFDFKLSVTLLILTPSLASAANPPVWWTTRGIVNASSPSNLSPATIGQAKWMAYQAISELDGKIGAQTLDRLRNEVEAVAPLVFPQNPAEFENQRKVLAVGQLKAISAPFYQILSGLSPMWVESQLVDNGTRDPNDGASYYPWSTASSDDENLAIAVVGQLKSVFALRFEADIDENQLPDFWEYQFFGGLGNGGSVDLDGDGISNLAESSNGTNPLSKDSDGDGYDDNLDYFPLDPIRWLAAASGNDTTAPQITLHSPGNATPL